MATLYDYFVKDGASNLTTHETWEMTREGKKVGDVIARLHLDFEARAKFLSFFIPDISGVECPEIFALNNMDAILSITRTKVGVSGGFQNESQNANDLVFTGQVYLYSERPIADDVRRRISKESQALGQHITFRSAEYVAMRNRFEKPRAFISHDSRDKVSIAEPIARKLQTLMCPVWFDQYSLKVGDGLRESIERGLRECPKCILILTPNFLNNNGWTKREYDSIFTREIVERQKVILPVWHDISAEDVYKYSPILADRVAAQWRDGEDAVARKLLIAIDSQS